MRKRPPHAGVFFLAPRSAADEFRAKGVDCIKRATCLSDPEHKQFYYDLAVQWIALAAEAEAQLAKSDSHPLGPEVEKL
jgi:hypothetical protein